MSIVKNLSELLEAGVISQETADKVRDYYQNKRGPSQNKLFVVFGILGAILVGLGVILIIAHNWDDLSRTAKTFIAFFPLLGGQILCGITLLKRPESITWRESSAAFLFFAVGASISLVSQIYNIPGNLSGFLLTWMLLCFPLIYLMKSSVSSLLYIIGITYYAGETGYWSYSSSESNWYWVLLLLVLPHYYILYKKKPESNFMIFHNWIVPLSVIIALGTVADRFEELLFVAYFSLFGLLYLIGNTPFFNQQRVRNHGYLILGSLGTLSLLLGLSFDGFWQDLRTQDFRFNEVIFSPEFIAASIITLLGIGVFFLQKRHRSFSEIKPMEPIFILFIIAFIIGLVSPVSVVLINLYIFLVSILTIKDGVKRDHLGVLNYGLLIMMALVICKFFDSDISFVARGILFLSVGIGFFLANYVMLKKRRA